MPGYKEGSDDYGRAVGGYNPEKYVNPYKMKKAKRRTPPPTAKKPDGYVPAPQKKGGRGPVEDLESFTGPKNGPMHKYDSQKEAPPPQKTGGRGKPKQLDYKGAGKMVERHADVDHSTDEHADPYSKAVTPMHRKPMGDHAGGLSDVPAPQKAGKRHMTPGLGASHRKAKMGKMLEGYGIAYNHKKGKYATKKTGSKMTGSKKMTFGSKLAKYNASKRPNKTYKPKSVKRAMKRFARTHKWARDPKNRGKLASAARMMLAKKHKGYSATTPGKKYKKLTAGPKYRKY